MSKHYQATFWFGIVIGVLAILLMAALAILFVPRLQPLIGLNTTNQRAINAPATQTNTLSNNLANTLVNNTVANLPDNTISNVYNNLANTSVDTTSTTPTKTASIKVTEPAPNDVVGNPLIIRGEARVFENVVSLRVKDSNGTVLAEAFTNAAAPDVGQFGAFEISLTYKKPQGAAGTVEVYESSAKDGSEINKVTIPVRFK